MATVLWVATLVAVALQPQANGQPVPEEVGCGSVGCGWLPTLSPPPKAESGLDFAVKVVRQALARAHKPVQRGEVTLLSTNTPPLYPASLYPSAKCWSIFVFNLNSVSCE